ncbi:YetF domain-containing protein [Robertmurraya sp. GLU-23]
MEGKIDTTTLEHLNKDEIWLKEELSKMQVKLSDVFLASINENLALHISLHNQNQPNYINH